MKREELHTFFLGMTHFLNAGGHFLFRTTIHDSSMLCAQAFGGSYGIHSRISTSNDNYVLTTKNGRIHLLARSPHQVHTREVLV